jgi:hypothetical protein
MSLRDQHPDRVSRTMREENRKRGKPRNKSKRCHPDGSPHHILFGDTHLQKTIRVRLCEFVGLR